MMSLHNLVQIFMVLVHCKRSSLSPSLPLSLRPSPIPRTLSQEKRAGLQLPSSESTRNDDKFAYYKHKYRI